MHKQCTCSVVGQSRVCYSATFPYSPAWVTLRIEILFIFLLLLLFVVMNGCLSCCNGKVPHRGINKGSYFRQTALEITLPFHFEVHLLVPPPLFLPFLEGLDKLQDQPKQTCNKVKSALIDRFAYN